jgi:hypothetical protein
MTGTNDNPGVIPNAVDEVFQYILEVYKLVHAYFTYLPFIIRAVL